MDEVTLQGGNGPATLPVTPTDAAFFLPLITEATALLAVAVLITLIGVGNTLSLSVLERRTRCCALGLTRRQLRGMLAVEAVLVAGVAALLGSVLGIAHGWLGTQSGPGGGTLPCRGARSRLISSRTAGLLSGNPPSRLHLR